MVDNETTGSSRSAARRQERETSIRRSLEVLNVLGTPEAVSAGGLGVTRIALLLEREKSQVSRTLTALAEFGFVDRDPDTRVYRLGWGIHALAGLAGERRLLDAARPVLLALVQEFDERSFLSVLQGAETLTLLSEAAPRSVQAVGWTGRRGPAYCSSVGRALLFDHDAVAIRSLFAAVAFARFAPATPRSVTALLRRLDADRQRGYSVAQDELEPELTAVAAPVRNASGRIVAAVNVSGPTFRFGPRVAEAGRSLVDAAARIGSIYREPPDRRTLH